MANPSLFWNYAGSICLYTLLSIGVVYAIFLYLKHNPSALNHPLLRNYRGQGHRSNQPPLRAPSDQPFHWLAFLGFNMTPKENSVHSEQQTFVIESTLHLTPQKTLYVVRCDQERFLIASSDHGIQCISPLDVRQKQENVVSQTQPSLKMPMPSEDTTSISPFHQQLQSQFTLLTQSIYS